MKPIFLVPILLTSLLPFEFVIGRSTSAPRNSSMRNARKRPTPPRRAKDDALLSTGVLAAPAIEDCKGCGEATSVDVVCTNKTDSHVDKWPKYEYPQEFVGKPMKAYGRWSGKDTFVITAQSYDLHFGNCRYKKYFDYVQPWAISKWYRFEVRGDPLPGTDERDRAIYPGLPKGKFMMVVVPCTRQGRSCDEEKRVTVLNVTGAGPYWRRARIGK